MKPTTAALPALLTAERVAEELGVSRARGYELIKRNEIRSVYVGRLRRVRAEDFLAYVEALTDHPNQ